MAESDVATQVDESAREPTPAELLRVLPRKQVEQIYAEAFAKDDIQALRWMAKNDRYFLLTCVLGRGDARKDWLYERCREVEGDTDDHIDLWAREHYKSTIITFAGVIQEIIKDPEITVGIFSHNRPTAKKFLVQIKQELEGNKLLVRLFPEIFWENPKREAPRWSEDAGIMVKRKTNPANATVEAWGLVDGMPTGSHFRLMVYDDVVTEDSVTTPDMIRKTTERWELSDNLGARPLRQWMIGTRYHFGDTYGIVLKRGVFHERRHPATHDGTMTGQPVFLTDKEWQRKLANQSKPIIAAQQLLNPLAGSETRFDLKWLKGRGWEVRPKRLNVYIVVDPSKGKHASSDRTAVVVIGIDANRNKYLLDGWCHRMPLSKRWQVLKIAWNRWSTMMGVPMVQVGYEQFGMQTDLEYFEERMEIEKVSFPINELSWPKEGPKAKEQRIERLDPDLRMARLHLPKVFTIDDDGNIEWIDPTICKAAQDAIAAGERWRVAQMIRKKDEDGRLYNFIETFLEEYTFFPFAPHDDVLDATSRIYDMDPVPPVFYESEPGRPMSLEPEVFPDT